MSAHQSVSAARRVTVCGNRLKVALCSAVLAVSLSGCLSSVLPKPESTRQFTLPAGSSDLKALDSPWQRLLVDELSPAPALDSDRLLAIGASGEVQRISDARWIARPAELVRAGLADRLRSLGAAQNVDRQSLRFSAELRLLGQLQAFQFNPDTSKVQVELDLHLLCAQANQSLADRRFEAAISSSAEAVALTRAHAQALDQIAVKVAAWISSESPERCTTN